MQHTLHKDIKTISLNTCPLRNFYCPKSLGDNKDVYKNGTRFISLNGEYLFHYFKKDEPYDENVNFKKVMVPMVWECYGEGYTRYVNDRYLIEYNPPLVPDSDYGVYKKQFSLNKKDNKRYYINFEGKDSCLYLYINDCFVGFDSVSHCTSEFDITDYVIDGQNNMTVFVYTYCVGTYLECQDKFRHSGLFRDIYILERETEHIESYKITYQKTLNNDIEVSIEFVSPEMDKNIIVYDQNIELLREKTSNNHIKFNISNPKLWNSEEPNLYLLEIICNNEVIYDYLSFRFISLDNNVFKINGQKVKLLGVNHHDSKYETGYYLSLDDYRKDVEIIKSLNMNCVRTSHYPPAPEFLFVADEEGIYVVDEADIECHGCVYANGDSYQVNDMEGITDNILFDEVIGDRIKRLLFRDFNRQSVIFWSGGNEAGYGQVIIKYLKYLKENDPSRLVHFESTYTNHPERNNYLLDFISKMYPSVDLMKDILKGDERAIYLCEFSHAMGNSNGDIHDYVEYFYSEDRVIGGCIWEFNDHLFPINGDISKPGYGGDFNEPVHSGNFCVDGMLNYKRELTSNALEIKSAFARLQIVEEDDGFYLINRYDFTNVDNISIDIVEHLDYIKQLKDLSLKVGEKIKIYEKQYTLSLTFNIYLEDKLYHTISFLNDETYSHSLTSDGQVLKKDKLIIENNLWSVEISKETGLIDNINFQNHAICNGSSLALKRAPIDNDRYEIDQWTKDGILSYKTELDKFDINKNSIEVYVKCSNVAKGKIIYQVEKNILGIKLAFNINENISYLPRFGYVLNMKKEFDSFEYVGLGEGESYCDKHWSTSYGSYHSKIESECPYVKPQEYGSHLAKMVILTTPNLEIKIKGIKSFSYLPYSIDELSEKKHNYELKVDEESNYLSLDYFMSGVGTHACGPELLDIHKLKDKKINMQILLEGK